MGTQISAIISEATKELLERHSRATGLKKAYLIESALRHHLLALQELPADVVVPARVVVSRKSGDRLLKETSSPSKPTAALRELMSDGNTRPSRRR